MRTALHAGLLIVFSVIPLAAGPIACASGTEASFNASGCTASVGGYDLTVIFSGRSVGTNTPGATFPNDQMKVLFNPMFSALPGGGFEQSFQITLSPGSWVGIPGQNLQVVYSFQETLSSSVSAITQTVTSVQSGTVTSELCTGQYSFGTLCRGGAEFKQTTSGTSATVSVGPQSGHYGFQGSFDGILPNGTFGGITIVTDVGSTVPEPSSMSFMILSLLVALVLRFHRAKI